MIMQRCPPRRSPVTAEKASRQAGEEREGGSDSARNLANNCQGGGQLFEEFSLFFFGFFSLCAFAKGRQNRVKKVGSKDNRAIARGGGGGR
mmetsp:Transcript_14624/g.20485  ORF Transcript_14624/g.20485 Transcript_14624/m.20485 type:complete len:91 (+) Transcript_14624:147-419(+)